MNDSTVYHGSARLFDDFSYKYIGQNGISRGAGFYFTDDRQLAEYYAKKQNGNGHLYTVELNDIKPVYNGRRLTRKDWRFFFMAMDDDFLSNYDYSIQEALDNELIGPETDIDILLSVCHAMGQYKKPLMEFSRLFDYNALVYSENGHTVNMGYESIKLDRYSRKIFVALVPDIIKIVSVEDV